MAISTQDVAQPARPTRKGKNLAGLGKISLIVAFMGIISMLLIYTIDGGQHTNFQKYSIAQLPFLGVEIIAFVTGVLAWETKTGKGGAIASTLGILAFFMSVM